MDNSSPLEERQLNLRLGDDHVLINYKLSNVRLNKGNERSELLDTDISNFSVENVWNNFFLVQIVRIAEGALAQR